MSNPSNKKLSLLEKAKSIKGNSIIQPSTDDSIDLAVGYIKGEITLAQLAAVAWPGLGRANLGTRAYVLITRSLRRAYHDGIIQVVKKS